MRRVRASAACSSPFLFHPGTHLAKENILGGVGGEGYCLGEREGSLACERERAVLLALDPSHF